MIKVANFLEKFTLNAFIIFLNHLKLPQICSTTPIFQGDSRHEHLIASVWHTFIKNRLVLSSFETKQKSKHCGVRSRKTKNVQQRSRKSF